MSGAPNGRSGQRLGQVVLDELKERLLDGRYEAGARLSIEELKAEFGVSKQPVMDALRRLETVGIVEIIPQSGCRVAVYSLQEVRDFFKLFGRSEGELAAAAAARRTDEQLRALEDVWQRTEDLGAGPDPETRRRGYRGLNREFHLTIHRMAHSRIMAELSERMWDMSDFFIATFGSARLMADAVRERNHDHDVIRHAIRSRKAEVARVAMESHIVGTLDLFT
ncbi:MULTISPECIES: GntR family transcriptional regulator [Actinomadura]|uniref:GntR family transcriptional regulator n=1 Tax=Actinomadura TaxID=1988 RepID=UPI0018F5CFA0|nr:MULTISPECIES: GntR family transcriptional regulator [Actinomadura]